MSQHPPAAPPPQERYRSLPRSYPFLVAVTWTSLFYLLLSGLVASVTAYCLHGNAQSVALSIAFPIAALVIWAAAYLSRRKAHCPLCKGTPLLDSRATPHAKATRIFPLNFGTSNLLRILFTRRFRCQFCGSPFDLLKVQNRDPNS